MQVLIQECHDLKILVIQSYDLSMVLDRFCLFLKSVFFHLVVAPSLYHSHIV